MDEHSFLYEIDSFCWDKLRNREVIIHYRYRAGTGQNVYLARPLIAPHGGFWVNEDDLYPVTFAKSWGGKYYDN